MSANTKIEWCDHTFNPWIGCTRISTAETGGGGCDGCYAAVSTPARAMKVMWGATEPRHRTAPSTWKQPTAWNKAHHAFFAKHGRRQRVFCASLADVFDNQVPTEWRMDLFKLIADTPNLDWLLLTKRIGNVMPMCSGDSLMFDLIQSRVWLGATVVNQKEADRDIPKLLAVPAHKRFLSMEPLLGPVSFEGMWVNHADPSAHENMLEALDWVIVGGESGPGARPMHPDWARSLRDQCEAAGAPFLFKQWGEYLPVGQSLPGYGKVHGATGVKPGRMKLHHGGTRQQAPKYAFADHGVDFSSTDDGRLTFRIGKKAAGRLLDGIEHNGFPS